MSISCVCFFSVRLFVRSFAAVAQSNCTPTNSMQYLRRRRPFLFGCCIGKKTFGTNRFSFTLITFSGMKKFKLHANASHPYAHRHRSHTIEMNKQNRVQVLSKTFVHCQLLSFFIFFYLLWWWWRVVVFYRPSIYWRKYAHDAGLCIVRVYSMCDLARPMRQLRKRRRKKNREKLSKIRLCKK